MPFSSYVGLVWFGLFSFDVLDVGGRRETTGTSGRPKDRHTYPIVPVGPTKTTIKLFF